MADATTDGDAGGAGGNPVLAMGPEMLRHPQPTYAMLRDAAPALDIGEHGVLAISREAIAEVFRHPEVYASAGNADLGNPRPLIPLQIDPPEHKKYRKLLDPLFAPQRMAELAEPVARMVNDHIDRFVDDGEVDFVASFSTLVPTQVFLTMLGLPLEELPRFLELKDGIIRAHAQLGVPPDHPDVAAHRVATAQAIYDTIGAVVDERAAEPRDDLVSRFLAAEIDGHRLTRDDILDIGLLFFIAGLDTVSASLDCMFVYLAEHPDQRRRIVEDPSLIPDAVEEMLRWETPVMVVPRITTTDTELAGCPIAAGRHVLVMLGAADTDPDEFVDAAAVDFGRRGNRHLAFGGGVHRCLGSHLARMELRVALREWHARIPDYAIRSGAELEFTPGIRSLTSLPLLLGRSA